jgi:uncharacterized protein YggE
MLKKTLALFLIALAPCLAAASQLPDYPFIHVTGNASQYVLPDVGSIDFDVVAVDADPAAARARVDASVAEVQALAQAQGLAEDDVTVRDVRQTQVKAGGAGAEQMYQIRAGIHVNVSDLGKWQAVAGGLLGKANLDNFAVDFAPADRAQVEIMLTNEAIKDARKRAEEIAAGFGRKLGPVAGVTTGMLKNLGGVMGLVVSENARRTRGGNAKQVDKADIVNVIAMPFAQTVDVVFRIK